MLAGKLSMVADLSACGVDAPTTRDYIPLLSVSHLSSAVKTAGCSFVPR